MMKKDMDTLNNDNRQLIDDTNFCLIVETVPDWDTIKKAEAERKAAIIEQENAQGKLLL